MPHHRTREEMIALSERLLQAYQKDPTLSVAQLSRRFAVSETVIRELLRKMNGPKPGSLPLLASLEKKA